MTVSLLAEIRHVNPGIEKPYGVVLYIHTGDNKTLSFPLNPANINLLKKEIQRAEMRLRMRQ